MNRVKARLPLLLVILSAPFLLLARDPSVVSVKLEGFHPRIYSQEQTRYSLRSSSGSLHVIGTSFQRILKRDETKEGTVITLVTGTGLPEWKAPDTKKYLIDTPFLNLSSVSIKRTARQFSASRNRVTAVEEFVFSHISDKLAGIPLLPAKDVLSGRAGDCTEHSVLAVSLLRSLEIPARAIVGMLLAPEYNGEENVFVYHMWAEALVGGKWVLVDATRPGKKFPNRYIAFAEHNLRTEMPLAYLRTISAMPDLKVSLEP